MPIPLALIGLGIGAAGAIGKMIGRGKANKQMEKLIGQNPKYSANPIAGERLSLARTLLNARMPGAMQAEKNIYANQGNQIANINQNATDSSQALALASQAYGNTGNQLSQLGITEAQDYQRRYGNLIGAQEGVINEGDKVFGDETRRYGDLVNFRQAQNENRQNNWSEISNLGFGIANFGASGGFGNMFKKGTGVSQMGGSGMGAAPYGASVYSSLLNKPLMRRP